MRRQRAKLVTWITTIKAGPTARGRGGNVGADPLVHRRWSARRGNGLLAAPARQQIAAPPAAETARPNPPTHAPSPAPFERPASRIVPPGAGSAGEAEAPPWSPSVQAAHDRALVARLRRAGARDVAPVSLRLRVAALLAAARRSAS